jgi:hypothetical protein
VKKPVKNDTGVVGTGNAGQTAEKQKKLMKKLAVGIVNYAHLSAGGLAVLRAVRRSRRQALASSGDSSVSARSRPKQIFSLSGTKRANGAHFLRSTEVTF